MESWHYVPQKKILDILLRGQYLSAIFYPTNTKKQQDLSPVGENGGGRGEISWRLRDTKAS